MTGTASASRQVSEGGLCRLLPFYYVCQSSPLEGKDGSPAVGDLLEAQDAQGLMRILMGRMRKEAFVY